MKGTKTGASRRGFLGTVAAGAAALSASGVPSGAGAKAYAPPREPAERPHIVIVALLRGDAPAEAAAQASQSLLTEHAASGVAFTNFQCRYPFEAPSWPDLLPGIWGMPSPGEARRPDAIVEVFEGAGYTPGAAAAVDCGETTGPIPHRDPIASYAQAMLAGHRPAFLVLALSCCAQQTSAVAGELRETIDSTSRIRAVHTIWVPPFGRGDPGGSQAGPPLVLSQESRLPQRALCSVAATPNDIMPTACGLAGVAVPPDTRGLDLSGLVGAEPARLVSSRAAGPV